MGIFVNYCAGVERYILPAQNLQAVLVNILQYASNETLIRSTLGMFEICHPLFVMVDSGGYQLLQMFLKMLVVG